MSRIPVKFAIVTRARGTRGERSAGELSFGGANADDAPMRDWLATALGAGIEWALPEVFAALALCAIATAIAALVAALGVNLVIVQVWGPAER